MTNSTKFSCEFCKRAFSEQRFLFNHMCERKRRYLQRDDKVVKVALMMYHRWWERRMSRRNLPTMESFENTQFYASFVRFARYLDDINAINPLGFVDFLARIEAPIDNWRRPDHYEAYIRDQCKNELPGEAIDRNIMLIDSWAIESGEDWRSFFRKVSPARATQWIISGRISPWLLLIASSAADLLVRLSPEQMRKVEVAIDSSYWTARMARHRDEVEELRAMLKEFQL